MVDYSSYCMKIEEDSDWLARNFRSIIGLSQTQTHYCYFSYVMLVLPWIWTKQWNSNGKTERQVYSYSMHLWFVALLHII